MDSRKGSSSIDVVVAVVLNSSHDIIEISTNGCQTRFVLGHRKFTLISGKDTSRAPNGSKLYDIPRAASIAST
jgi:hypothetical protein